MTNNDEKNYYEILETPYDSSFELLKENYTKARNAYSTDSLALYSLLSEHECNRILETIDEAYSILSDSNKRKLYDEAKGIKSVINTNRKTSQEEQPDSLSSTSQSSKATSVNKIISSNVFSLDFQTNSEMEKEIEQCSEFTGEFLKKIREYKNVDIKRMADLTKVSKTYIKYIEKVPTDNKIAKTIGLYFYDKKKYKKAISYLEKVKDTKLYNTSYYRALGQSYYKTQNYTKKFYKQ